MANGHYRHEPFPAERKSPFAQRKPLLQHAILPLLQYGRCAVPVKGVVKNDETGREQPLLFQLDINMEIRVLFIEINDFNPWYILNCAQQRTVYAGLLRVGVGKEDEDFAAVGL